MPEVFEGFLEIHNNAIYFHNKANRTLLRIGGLQGPIPELNKISSKMIDIKIESANVNYLVESPLESTPNSTG